MFNDSENVCIDLIEVEDAEPMAGELFQKSFNSPIPDFPKHFILLAEKNAKAPLVLAYAHATKLKNIYLGGGMCVDYKAIRSLPKSIRKDLSKQGGVAYSLLTASVQKLTDCDAVFAYVGHQAAYKIDLAVGFKPTQHKHLIVYWKKQLDETKQNQLIELAHQQGPF